MCRGAATPSIMASPGRRCQARNRGVRVRRTSRVMWHEPFLPRILLRRLPSDTRYVQLTHSCELKCTQAAEFSGIRSIISEVPGCCKSRHRILGLRTGRNPSFRSCPPSARTCAHTGVGKPCVSQRCPGPLGREGPAGKWGA